MAYEVKMGKSIVGVLGQDGKVKYDDETIKNAELKEIIAGQASTGKTLKGFVSTPKVVYRFDKNRRANNDAIYNMWKANPIAKNRVRQLNALIFGRGLTYQYDDDATMQIIDRFWRLNRLRQKLNPMGTDVQLYGETFIALYPQNNGDVLVTVYESNQVDVDFNAGNIEDIQQYIVSYKDESTQKDMQLKFLPVYKYLNELEFNNTPLQKLGRTVKRMLGTKGGASLGGFAGAMIHIKFNNSSSEVHGTSDFRQAYPHISNYMNFRSDRQAIHEIYGSPAYDITIADADSTVIEARVAELAGFTIGSNPVHNDKESWKPLEFQHTGGTVDIDEKASRGLICAGLGFPEHLLFNQAIDGESPDSTNALNKLAEDMQDTFGDAFIDMHKFVVATAGGDITLVDAGEIIFPEISTMSEKAKAETYVLKVGANICSRKTAALNTGHNWAIEEKQILKEQEMLGIGASSSNMAGVLGGRFSSRKNNQDSNRDDGSDDRKNRSNAQNISTQTFGDRKTNN